MQPPAHPILHRVADAIRLTPPVQALLHTNTWKSLRHRIALATDRRQHFTFTRFLRLPPQFDALAGPVVDHVAPAGRTRSLDIVAIGCSIGAAPYSVASVLVHRHPDLQFTIRASDVDPAVLAHARAARYATSEVFANPEIPRAFVAATFDQVAGGFVVKPDITWRVRFEVADVLDPGLARRVGTADVLMAQNLLYNFPPAQAKRAFANLLTVLRLRSALFVDGMDLGMRQHLTRRAGLAPLDAFAEEIHEAARRERAVSWPWRYYGLEPFNASHRHARWRYATIFLKG